MPVTIGDAMRMIRRGATVSPRKMAIQLGVSHVHVVNIENGHTGVSLELLARVRERFGISPMALVVYADETLDVAEHRNLLAKRL